MRSLWFIPASVALSLSAVLPSMALTVTFTGGLTTLSPTFDSPSQNGTNPPNSTFSQDFGFFVDFPYSSQPFYVNTSGNYDFLSTSLAYTTNPNNNPSPLWNNYTVLYVNNFDPNNPLTNAIIVNDNLPTQGLSGFNGVNLTANTQYYFVTTVFNPDDGYGTFNNSITGTGNITLSTVPFEFSHSLGLLVFGGCTAVNWLRKKKQQSLLASKSEQQH